MFFMSFVSYAFVCVCLYVYCGQYPGSGVVLDCIDS